MPPVTFVYTASQPEAYAFSMKVFRAPLSLIASENMNSMFNAGPISFSSASFASTKVSSTACAAKAIFIGL